MQILELFASLFFGDDNHPSLDPRATLDSSLQPPPRGAHGASAQAPLPFAFSPALHGPQLQRAWTPAAQHRCSGGAGAAQWRPLVVGRAVAASGAGCVGWVVVMVGLLISDG